MNLTVRQLSSGELDVCTGFFCKLNSENSPNRSMLNILCLYILSKILKTKIYKTAVVPVILCGCETWYFTHKGTKRVGALEDRMLRRVFGLHGRGKSTEVILWACADEEFHNLLILFRHTQHFVVNYIVWLRV